MKGLKSIFHLTVLKNGLNQIVKDIPKIYPRDIIDHIDEIYFLSTILKKIQTDIINGQYTPSYYKTIRQGKPNGRHHNIAIMDIVDLLIYKTLTDFIYRNYIPDKPKKAYLQKKQGALQFGSSNIKGKCLIHTDITNFFDSISYKHLTYALSKYADTKTIQFLDFFLRNLNSGSSSTRLRQNGLPIDGLDCSRQISHIFLYPYDRFVISMVGDQNYIRWVDDQIIILPSRSLASKLVPILKKRLSLQSLSLNIHKTIILNNAQTSNHFHLKEQLLLLNWKRRYLNTDTYIKHQIGKKTFYRLITAIYSSNNCVCAYKLKILKELYNLAASFRHPGLIDKTYADLIALPGLDEYIFTYLITMEKYEYLLSLFNKYCRRKNRVFEITEVKFFELILSIRFTHATMEKYRYFVREYTTQLATEKKPFALASAIFALYWLNENSVIMKSLFSRFSKVTIPHEIRRSLAFCYGAIQPDSLPLISHKKNGPDIPCIKSFTDLIRNQSGFGQRQTDTYIAYAKRLDNPHSLLLLELLSHTRNKTILKNVRAIVESSKKIRSNLPAEIILQRINKYLS